VASKDDNLFVDSICQEFSRHIRGARYVEVETGGHLLATSQPEFVAQQILDFLKPKEDQKAS
jgi:pimeloyl-ACP methyl ester carboxylesterase